MNGFSSLFFSIYFYYQSFKTAVKINLLIYLFFDSDSVCSLFFYLFYAVLFIILISFWEYMLVMYLNFCDIVDPTLELKYVFYIKNRSQDYYYALGDEPTDSC